MTVTDFTSVQTLPVGRISVPVDHAPWRYWGEHGVDVLAVECPECHAPPDEWCPRGVGNLHTARIFAAVAGGAA